MAFSQTLLQDVTANEETNKAILEMLEMDERHSVQYHVYEVAYKEKQIFCCLSGGLIENNEIQFTAVGLAAFEALTNIGNSMEAEYFAEQISIDSADLAAQICEVFDRVPSGARVCFIGDITGELKHELAKYFTLVH